MFRHPRQQDPLRRRAGAVATKSRITTAQATLSKLPADYATAVNPHRLPFSFRRGLVRTRAEVTVASGSTVTAEAGASAIARYGSPTWSEDLSQLDSTINAAQGIADAVIVMFGQERYGPASADIRVLSTGAHIEDLLTLELGDRVTVRHTAPAGHSIDVEAHVQGIRIHGGLDGSIDVTVTLAAAEFIDSLNPTDWLIWDTGSWDVNKWGFVA
ncbi:MAG: hypothetical protein R2695_04165 [Acidimicrobiales bacterium]